MGVWVAEGGEEGVPTFKVRFVCSWRWPGEWRQESWCWRVEREVCWEDPVILGVAYVPDGEKVIGHSHSVDGTLGSRRVSGDSDVHEEG